MKSALAENFSARAVHHLHDDFLPKLRKCFEQLSDEEIWWRPNESSNSVGNLILHLCGNVRQWILAGVAAQPDERDRPREFATRGPLDRELLLRRLNETVDEAVRVITAMGDEELLRRHQIQVYDVTGLEALFHVVEHFSHHTGQIIYITKLLKDTHLRFYDDEALSR